MSQIIYLPMYYSVAWKHINKYLYLLINSLIIINPNNLFDLTTCFFQINKQFSHLVTHWEPDAIFREGLTDSEEEVAEL